MTTTPAIPFEDFFQGKTPLTLHEEYEYLSARYNMLLQLEGFRKQRKGVTVTESGASWAVFGDKAFVVLCPPDDHKAVRAALDGAVRRGDWAWGDGTTE